ncbi:MAG: flagellar hook-basal body complex protein FliE [Desulfurivibrionaceae bacterium]|nr:flagellar hook-basal body complex protein FliE [Desulfurivibrionaceae bacterium]
MKTLPLTQIQQPLTLEKSARSPGDGTGFGEVLKKSLEGVNATIQESGQMTEGLVTGQHSNIHETMIAMEKSTVSFRMLTKVQQKVISAYQDIMRMQV